MLLVILPHLAAAGMIRGPQWFVHIVDSSAHGVELFFILSGFGLALPFLRQNQGTITLDVPTYVFNRLFRILPLFYVAIALTWLLGFLLIRQGHVPIWGMIAMPHGPYDVVAPLLLFDRKAMPVDPGLWTVAVQYRWYVVFPLLLILWVKSKRAFVSTLVAAWIGFLFWRTRDIDIGTLPLFMLGIVLAEMIARRRRATLPLTAVLITGIVAGLIWDRHAAVPDPWGIESIFAGQPTSFGWQIAAFALVGLAATFRPLQILFSAKPIVALGRASFSLYLVNQPVIGATQAILGNGAGVIAFITTIMVGFAFYLAIERPLSQRNVRARVRARTLPAVTRALSFVGVTSSMVIREGEKLESAA